MRPPHALSGERLAALGATRDSTTGCWGLPFVRRAVVLALSTALLSAVPAGAQTSGEKLEDLRARAEQGDAEAQINLGIRYVNGEGVPEDDREAVRWFRLAAEQGDASAQAILGSTYQPVVKVGISGIDTPALLLYTGWHVDGHYA